MKISTKGRYGLRAMVDIAVSSSGDHVALNSIAERQNISENYLEQVFSILRKAGLVKSVKGAQGGYTIANSTSNITVGDILRVLEGELTVVDDESDKKEEKTIENLLSLKVWKKIDESVNDVVNSITLEDIVEEYKKLNGDQALMFYI
jgi:Rrf2 family protein